MNINFAEIFEIGRMLLIIIGYVAAIVVVIWGWNEFRDEVVCPWEKKEKKAAKKREREQRRARREFWGS